MCVFEFYFSGGDHLVPNILGENPELFKNKGKNLHLIMRVHRESIAWFWAYLGMPERIKVLEQY